MTSRERVLRAVHFEASDRVPIDLGGFVATGINAAVYDRLKKRLGIDAPTKIQSVMAMLAEVELEALDRLHADVVPLDTNNVTWAEQEAQAGVRKRLFCGIDAYFPPNTNIQPAKDGSWILYNHAGEPFARMPKDGYYFDYLKPTMSSGRVDPDRFQPSRTVPDEQLEIVGARAKHLFENTDKAILGWGASISIIGLSDVSIVAENLTQGSLDTWLLMLMTEKETAHDMMGRYVDATIEKMRLYHQAVGEACFAWVVGADDAGTQKGVVMAPELFTEMVKPHYRRLCDWVHANTRWKTYLHSCGSIYHYIGEWIDAGIDILNPVQISAAHMEPERLMNDFGGRIVFWGGGCDTQRILPLGTAEEIREHVLHNLRIFSSGEGGYVFAQVHNIQQDVPVESVEQMLAAALEGSSATKPPSHLVEES